LIPFGVIRIVITEEGKKDKKNPCCHGLFLFDSHQCCLGMDGIHGTGIHASAAVDAGIGVDNTLATLLADGVYRA
jgi:hypothetical protein